MITFDRLKKIYSSLGVYKLSEDSNIINELKAYSAGLEILRTALLEFEHECFISTAEDYGIKRRELMFGAVRDDLPLDMRRNMLLRRIAFGEGDFTNEGIGKILDFLGIEGTVKEYPAENRVEINVHTKGLTKGQRNWVLSQVAGLFPAHLESDVVFD